MAGHALTRDALKKELAKYKHISHITGRSSSGSSTFGKRFDALNHDQKSAYNAVQSDLSSDHNGGLIEGFDSAENVATYGSILKACDKELSNAQSGSLILVADTPRLKAVYDELTSNRVGLRKQDVGAFSSKPDARHLVMTYDMFNRLYSLGRLDAQTRSLLILDDAAPAISEPTKGHIQDFANQDQQAFTLGFTPFYDADGQEINSHAMNSILFGRAQPIHRQPMTASMSLDSRPALKPLSNTGQPVTLPDGFEYEDFYEYLDYLALAILPGARQGDSSAERAQELYDFLKLHDVPIAFGPFKVVVDCENPQIAVDRIKAAITEFLEERYQTTDEHEELNISMLPAKPTASIAAPDQPKSVTVDHAAILEEKLAIYNRYREVSSDATFPDEKGAAPDLQKASQKLGAALDGNIALPDGCHVDLFPDQRISIKAFQQALNDNQQDARLVAPPRSGKTYIYGYSLMALMAKKEAGKLTYDGYSLYTAPSIRIAKQTRDTLIEQFKIPESDVGYIDGDTPTSALKTELNKPIQIMVKDTAVSLFRNDRDYSRFKDNPRKISDYKLFVPDELQGYTGDAGMGLYNAFKRSGAVVLGLTGSDTLMLIRNHYGEIVDRVTIGDVLQGGRRPIRDIPPSEAAQAGSVAPTLEYIVKMKSSVRPKDYKSGDLTERQQNEIHNNSMSTVVQAFQKFKDKRLPYKPSEQPSIWFAPPSNLKGHPGYAAKNLVKHLNETFYDGYADCIYHGKNKDGSPKTGPSNDENQNVIDRFNRGEIKAIVNVNMLMEGITLPPACTVWETCPTNSPRKKIQSGFRASTLTDAQRDKIASCFTLSIPGVAGTSLTEIYGETEMSKLEDVAATHFTQVSDDIETGAPTRPGSGGRKKPSQPPKDKPESAPESDYEIISSINDIAQHYRDKTHIAASDRKPDGFLTKEEYINYVTQNGAISVPYTSVDNLFSRLSKFVRSHLPDVGESELLADDEYKDEQIALLGATLTMSDAGYYFDASSPSAQLCVSKDIAEQHRQYYEALSKRKTVEMVDGRSATQMANELGIDGPVTRNLYRTLAEWHGKADREPTDELYLFGSRFPHGKMGYLPGGRTFVVDRACADDVKRYVDMPTKGADRWGNQDVAKQLATGSQRADQLMSHLAELYKHASPGSDIRYNGATIPYAAFGYYRAGNQPSFTIEADTHKEALQRMLGKHPDLDSERHVTKTMNEDGYSQKQFGRTFTVLNALYDAFTVLKREQIDLSSPAGLDAATEAAAYKAKTMVSIDAMSEDEPHGTDPFGKGPKAQALTEMEKGADAIKKAIHLYKSVSDKGVAFDLEKNQFSILGIDFSPSHMGYFSAGRGGTVFALDRKDGLPTLKHLIDEQLPVGKRVKPDFVALERGVNPSQSKA